MEDVCCWLREIGLGAFQRSFTQHEIDGQSLLLLSDDDLKLLLPNPTYREKLRDELNKSTHKELGLN